MNRSSPQPQHRFYLPPEACVGDRLELGAAEAHHALQVLRLRPGEQVWVVNGAGGEWRCRIGEVARRRVSLEVLEHRDDPPPPYQLILIQAMVKGRAMDLILQKATELGAHRIIPIQAARSVSPARDRDAERKTQKWRQITIEALKQCGGRWLPHLDPPTPMRAFLESRPSFDLMLLAALGRDARHPRETFASFVSEHHSTPTTAAIWIGPEGDFTADECERIVEAGAQAVTLGPRVLRAETAALYGLSVLSYELQASVPPP